MTDTAIIIPARYQSSRFPGKPLVDIGGKTMIQRVYENAKASISKENIYIATDDERIKLKALEFTPNVIMTGECANGTERVYQAYLKVNKTYKYIINLQGDTPITPKVVLDALINNNSDTEIATPAVKLIGEKYNLMYERKMNHDTSGTLVVFDKNYNALYFSNSLIPFPRKKINTAFCWKHIGIYKYREDILKRYISLTKSENEELEELEQLRALEDGIKIQIVPVDIGDEVIYSVDSPKDLELISKIIKQ